MALSRLEYLPELKYSLVGLLNVADVVQYSFIVRNSISYLDLELCKYCKVHLSRHKTLSYCSRTFLRKDFVNTEEKYRKFMEPGRHLLYSLHLDLPSVKDCSLKHGPKTGQLTHLESFTIGKLFIYDSLYRWILQSLIEHVFKYTNRKSELLKWLLKFSVLRESELIRLPSSMVDYFVDFLCTDTHNSAIMEEFFKNFYLIDWILKYEKPDVLEYLLYHAHHNGRYAIKGNEISDGTLPGICIVETLFKNVGPLLKYGGAPRFCLNSYHKIIDEIWFHKEGDVSTEVLMKTENWMNRERNNLLLQIFWIYLTRLKDLPASQEALRLLWSSIPDPFISLGEIRKAYSDVLSSNEIKEMYQFYVESVGEDVEPDDEPVVQPRSLKQYCRTKIRRILWQNCHWLPDGIRQIGLPKTLQAFLNLESVLKS